MGRFLCTGLRRSNQNVSIGALIASLVWFALANPANAQDIPDDFGPPVAKSKAVYFPPEHFPDTNEWESFRIHATEFLQDHSDDTMAPRAIHDLILIEGIRAKPNQTEINELKTRLAFEYPDSLAMKMALKSFKEPGEFRTLLVTEFRKPNQTFSPDFCRQFLKASERGLDAFGPAFVNDDDFTVLIDLTLNSGKSYRLKQLSDQKWSLMKGLAKSGMEICRNAELSNPDKVVGLHQLSELTAIKQQNLPACLRDAERFWLTRLSQAARQLPPIRAILIEQLITERKYPEALASLDELLVLEQQPKWLFWQAWCLICEQDYTAAAETLARLSKQFPGDLWARQGAELASALRDRDVAIRENAAALFELLTELRGENFDWMQLTLVHKSANGRSIEAWVTGDAVNHSLDLFVNHDQAPLVGYKATLKDYSIFLRDQAKVVQINKPGMFLDLTFALGKVAQGLTYHFNFNTVSTPAAAESWRRVIQDVARHPLLVNPDVITTLMGSNIKGAIPLRMRIVEDRRVLEWWAPEINQPQMRKYEFEMFPKEQHRLRARSGAENFAEMTFGKAGTQVLESRWKGLPIVEKEEIDFGLIFQAFSVASSLWKTEDNTISTEVPRDHNVVPVGATGRDAAEKVVQPLGAAPK